MSEGGALTRHFGPEVKTIYSGNVLNRLSFLREDSEFLHRAFHSPDALFLTLRHFNPLLREDLRLEWVPLSKVSELVGDPYAKSQLERAQQWDPERDASGVSHAQVIFLGVDDAQKGAVSGDDRYPGAPRFAVDVSVYDQATDELKARLEAYQAEVKATEDVGFRSVIFGVELEDSADYSVIAEARIVLDWINRTRFCAGCGRRNMSVWGGFKLSCPTSFSGATQCPTKGQVTNLSFPRTDTCIIVAVVSNDGSKVLIARGKRFRIKMYSCLAGFLESGESIEDCVRREVFEEAGLTVGRVVLFGSQPWPYPANLMIGCIAEVANADAKSHEIHLGHDKELLDAKWMTQQEMQVLCRGEGDFDFVVPPRTSIAWVLLDAASTGTYLNTPE